MRRGICSFNFLISCRQSIRGQSMRIEGMITESMAIQTKLAVRKGAIFREIEACNRWMIFPIETVAIAALCGGGCMTSCKFARTHPTPAESSAEEEQQSSTR